MPDFLPERHGVTLSQALHEAAVASPVTRMMLSTFELWHESFAEPIYVVNDHENLTAFKEAAAERDAGLQVEYLACAVTISRPEESDQAGTPEITVSVDNVSGLLSDALRAARGSIEPWELIERVYASDDLSGPAIDPPLKVMVTGVDMDGETVTLRASFGDPVNVAVPRLTFKRSEYPGLVR